MGKISEHRGRVGEDLAVDFMRLQEYTILARNYRHYKSEIDIIAKQGNTVVFTEVKIRLADSSGASPFESVGPKKQEMIVKGALHYAASQFGHGINLRFDVIGLTWDEDGGILNVVHIRNAFSAKSKYYY